MKGGFMIIDIMINIMPFSIKLLGKMAISISFIFIISTSILLLGDCQSYINLIFLTCNRQYYSLSLIITYSLLYYFSYIITYDIIAKCIRNRLKYSILARCHLFIVVCHRL